MEKQNKRQQWLNKRYGQLNEQDRDENLKKVGEKGNVLKRPIYKDDDKNKDIIGHEMRVDPYDTITIDHPKKEGEKLEVYQSPMAGVFWIKDCDVVEEFMNEHKSLMDKLYKKYGNLLLTEGSCPKYNPHLVDRDYKEVPGYENIDGVKTIAKKPYGGPEKSKDVSENIKLDFLRLTRHNFGTYDPTRKEDNSAEAENFIKSIKKKLIPEIILDDKRYTDMSYDNKWSNEHIRLRAHNINYFTNQKDFKQAASLVTVGRTPGNVESSSMARQYLDNSPHKKWDPTKKAKREYLGVTPRRKQDKVGLSMKEYNVLMKGDFELNGEKIGENEFRWSLNYQLSFAKKRPDDFQIGQEKLEVIPESEIFLTNVVKISPDKHFDDRNTIAQDVEIMQGLQEIYSDFKSKLQQLDPRVLLKLSNISRIDIETVNESVYKKVMFNLLKESIKK